MGKEPSSLDSIVNQHLTAARNGTIAAVASTVFGLMMDPVNVSIQRLGNAAVAFGSLIYSTSLMQSSKSIFGKLASTTLAALPAIYSGYLIYNTVPAVFNGLFSAFNSIAAGSYSAAALPIAATGVGLALGYGLCRKIYHGAKNAYTAIGETYDAVSRAIGGVFRGIAGIFKPGKA